MLKVITNHPKKCLLCPSSFQKNNFWAEHFFFNPHLVFGSIRTAEKLSPTPLLLCVCTRCRRIVFTEPNGQYCTLLRPEGDMD
jgi:hypothetical protein